MNASIFENNNNYTVRDDATDPNNEYVGEAIVGTLENVIGWRIKKIVTSGSITKVLWAQDSNNLPQNNFQFIWASRATYTYS